MYSKNATKIEETWNEPRNSSLHNITTITLILLLTFNDETPLAWSSQDSGTTLLPLLQKFRHGPFFSRIL